MEAATPLRLPSVTEQGDRIRIDGLVVVDETAARLVREGADPDAIVSDSIEIGARVLDREQTAANAEFVRTEFEKVAKEVEVEFGERARSVSEHFGKKVDEVFDPQAGQLARSLEELFSDGSTKAVQHRVRELVGESLRQSRLELLKQFSAADGSNPLADFKAGTVEAIRSADERQHKVQTALLAKIGDLDKQLQGLRDEKEKLEEVAAERERGTAKGRTYEESVAVAIDTIAAVHGDIADAVGDERGAGGRKGDVLVGIDGCLGPDRGRVVFEAKDSRLSKPRFHEDLDAAMEQRDADYAVLVVPTPEEVPARLHSLREYQGDKLIAIYDPADGSTLELEFAYRVARARASAAGDGEGEIDPVTLRATLARANAALDEVRKIKSQLTAAQNGIGGARDLLEAVEGRVRAELASVDEQLASVG